ncbi:TadE/TadG family type IV pilus assembly protein [Raineyella fluvialis]|uniref:Pilus assembly protein n=1 Tax=Raineyella fluvialis TaxID=2662261 RepID=A0A5Q2FFJ3_9ACTN|nr:TadE family protein [Raineyella fluvialis]QGF24294.1 pilus assembly protein [Raineyella fluvialis]
MRKSDRGAEVVEFALLAPILMALILGTIEFGFAFLAQATIAGAAREAARDMAIHNNPDQARMVAVNAAVPVVVFANPTEEIGIAATCPTGAAGQVVVTINHPYVGLTGWLATVAPTGVTLGGKGVMRCGG